MLLDRLKMEFIGCFFITYIFTLSACNVETESLNVPGLGLG